MSFSNVKVFEMFAIVDSNCDKMRSKFSFDSLGEDIFWSDNKMVFSRLQRQKYVMIKYKLLLEGERYLLNLDLPPRINCVKLWFAYRSSLGSFQSNWKIYFIILNSYNSPLLLIKITRIIKIRNFLSVFLS